MAKNYISRISAVVAMGFAMLVTACDEPEPEVKIEPVFPSPVEKTVIPGETVTLNFDANMDWEVSVPETSLTTFWIEDGAMDVAKVKGKAGEGISVIIGTTSTEEFDERSCQVSMKMDGTTQQIAKVILPAKERNLAVYAAQVEDGEIQYTEGGGYLYGTSETETLPLIWSGSDFRLPVKVDANFSWTVKAPVWASVDVPEERIGEVTLNILGVPSEYPLADAQDKIRFMSGDTVIKEYVISIPGCEDIFSFGMHMGLTEIVFSHSGQLLTDTGFIDGPAAASVSGTSGVSVFAVELVDGKYDVKNSPSWLSIEVADYDETEGADVLQERDVEIAARLNEGDDRSAVVFFLPPAAAQLGNGLFNEAADAVKEEYAGYAVPVKQLSSDQEFVMMLSSSSEMTDGGASFTVSSDESLFTRFGKTRYAYELVYTNQYARDYARMTFTSPVTSYAIFDAAGADVTEAGSFLTLALDEDSCGGVIDMVSETDATGYVVLYGTSGNVLAVIKCTFAPEKIIVEEDLISFIGESIEAAPLAGATLERLTKGELFDIYTDGMSPVYHLRYTKEDVPMSISLPTTVKKHDVNPWSMQYNIRVNDTVYSETIINDMVGGIKLQDGGVTIYMDMPEGENFMRGNINFRKKNEDIVLILVCTLDLTGAEK